MVDLPRADPLPGGGLAVTLGRSDRAALRQLPDHMRPILAGQGDTPLAEALRTRLYPPAYDDADLDAEYRDLVGSGLVDQRMDQLETFAATLAGGVERSGRWTIDLDATQAQVWLAVVNDTRLALGTILGITEDGQLEDELDPEDWAAVLLSYLGVLTEELVGALMAGLEG